MGEIIEAVAKKNEMVEINEVINLQTIKSDGLAVMEKYNVQIKKFLSSKDIENLIKNASEESLKDLKSIRTEVRKEIAGIEDRRKEIEKIYKSDLEDWKKIYKKLAYQPLESEELKLKKAIDNIEDGLKKKKENFMRQLFETKKQTSGIDFVKFEDMKLNILLSSSEEKMGIELEDFFEKISNDLEIINMGANQERVMVDYQNHRDLKRAIQNVSEDIAREKTIKEAKEFEESRRNATESAETGQESTKEVKVDTNTSESSHFMSVQFTVRATKPQLIALKNFMRNNLIDYK